eukprot:384617_1
MEELDEQKGVQKLLIDIISPNNNTRNTAQKQLEYFEANDFTKFVLTLCEVVTQQDTTHLRLIAALILKNSLRYSPTHQDKWCELPKNDQDRIKQAVLSLLDIFAHDSSKRLIVQIAHIISNLVSLDTLDNWNDLMPALLHKALSENRALIQGSLRCIENIADNDNDHSYLQTFSTELIECILHGANHKDTEIQHVAMACLCSVIQLLSPNIRWITQKSKILSILSEYSGLSDDVCNNIIYYAEQTTLIFQIVFQVASNHVDLPQLTTRYSFVAMQKLVECYYDLLIPYMDSIQTITIQCIKNSLQSDENESGALEAENDAVHAIKIWSTCAEIEQENTNNYNFCKNVSKILIPLYLKALLRKPEFLDDTSIGIIETWTLRKAAQASLECFVCFLMDDILQIIVDFITTNISETSSKCNDAALVAFGYILKSPHKQSLISLSENILQNINRLTFHQDTVVRYNAMWAFGRVVDIIPDVIGNKDIHSIISNSLGDRNGIVVNVCWIIQNLAKYYKQQQVYDVWLYKDGNAKNIIDEIVTRRDRIDSNDIVAFNCHEAINDIIYCAPDTDIYSEIVKSWLYELITQMKVCFSEEICASDFTSIRSQKKMAGIFSSISVCIDCVSKLYLDSNMTDTIMFCCTNTIFKQYMDTIVDEILAIIIILSRRIGVLFMRYLLLKDDTQQDVKGLLLIAIKHEAIRHNALKTVGDVYTQCQSTLSKTNSQIQLVAFTDAIVAEVLTILMEQTNDFELKGICIDTLIDIFIGYGDNASGWVYNILHKCLDIGIFGKNDHEIQQENILDFNQMRCSIIDLLRLLIRLNIGIDVFESVILEINSFFQCIANEKYAEDNVLKSFVALLSEISDHWNSKIRKQICIHHVNQIIHLIYQNNDTELNKMALDALKKFESSNPIDTNTMD